MKKNRWFFWLILLAVPGCEDAAQECAMLEAKSGYVTGGVLTYDFAYQLTNGGNKVLKLEIRKTETGELSSVVEYTYNSNGDLASEFRKNSNSLYQYHKYYTYGSKTLTEIEYTILGEDTLKVEESLDLYLENPVDGIYHLSTSSYKIENGNVVEFGYYSLSGTDTTDTFVERYEYDSHLNYYTLPEFRNIIPPEFKWAIVTSRNNLIRASSIGGGWNKPYDFQYGGTKLLQYVGPAGLTIDFEYQCH